MAKELRVTLEDKPGTLATLAEALGRAGVNIETIAGVPTAGGKGDIRVVVDDSAKARAALERSGMRVESERDVLVLDFQHKPGELARVARRLADAGVNVDSIYVLGQSGENKKVVLGVNDLQKAKAALP